jgi:hypothetical protein
LGYIAAGRRIKVKFITAADLILQLEIAQSQGKFPLANESFYFGSFCHF